MADGRTKRPKGKKGALVGSGGNNRRRLQGKGPTPKAEDRVYHPAHKRKLAAEAARREQAKLEKANRLRPELNLAPGHELIAGRNAVLEAVRSGIPLSRVFVSGGVASDERLGEVVRTATALGAPLFEASRTELDRMTDGAVHQGGAPASSGTTTSVGVGDRAPSSPQPRSGPNGSSGAASRRNGESAATSVDDVAHTATTAVPREILVPEMPSNAATVRAWLEGLRGGKVDLRVPQRGDKAALMDTVRKNAEEALRLHKTRRAGDLTQRTLALDELAEALDLPEAPLRVECYDISHTQGTYQVGSMVVFEDGAPRKSDYRRFTVRGQDGSGAADDTAAMHEVLTRRFKRLIAEQGRGEAAARAAQEIEDVEGIAVVSGPIDPETGKARRFSYAPGLVVVDGGLPQVNAARTVLDELGIDVPLIGLAKRLEEVWVPGEEFPVILPRTSPALYLLQHLRDESHRFAITHHRKKRSAGMTRSVLDGIPGLGPARQAALLREFGSVTRIRQADVDDITRVKGIGPALAGTILAHLNSPDTEQ